MSKYWKTYPLGSKEAMKREPSLEPLNIGWALEFKCQHGHEDCADKPNGDCWLDCGGRGESKRVNLRLQTHRGSLLYAMSATSSRVSTPSGRQK